MKNFIVLILSFIFTLPVKAADIFSLGGQYPNFFAILGPIQSGDYNRLVTMTNHFPYGSVVLFLNSQGGVAYEGMAMGEYVHSKGFVTVVTPVDECYSSCAIIWAGGKQKIASFPDSKIGFHALYDGNTGEQVGAPNAQLGAILGRWGYSDRAIVFMTDKGPQELNLLDANKAYKYNIIYTDFANLVIPSVNQTRYSLTPYDVVSGFYYALSIADGDLAAAYVIPEKRGVGPFNQSNIYRFYSSLRKPMTVHSITQLNSTQFKVNYSFIKTTSVCNGNATVTITNRNGYYLIQSIKANC